MIFLLKDRTHLIRQENAMMRRLGNQRRQGCAMKRLIWPAAVCTSFVLVLAIAQAQQTPYQYSTTNPVVSSAQEIFNRQSKFLMAGADEMPVDKYSYKPTPDQMTFGWIVSHVSQANFGACAQLADTAVPQDQKAAPTDPKDKLTAVLKSSFDFCTKALAGLTDSKLGDQVKFFGRQPVPRARMLIELTDDLEDHYSQMASYLRLNGLTPPSAQRKP